MAAENFKVKKGLEVGTGSTITSGGINVTGVITATQLVGDGSGLTNVVGSGSGIVVKDEGSAVGTAGTINFVGSGVVASLSAGQATVTIDSGGLTDVVDDTTPQLGGSLDLNSKFISGSGGINVSGVTTSTSLDVGSLTNGRVPYIGSASGRLVDSANLTFDGSNLFVSGINVTSAGTTSTFGADIVTRNFKATGVSTFSSHINASSTLTAFSGTFTSSLTVNGNTNTELLNISPDTGDDAIILVSSGGGQNNDFSRIRQVVSDDSFRIENKASGSYESLFQGTGSAGVKLYFAGTQKLETTGTGIASPNISVSGVGTFSTRIDTNGVTLGTNNNTFAAKFIDNAVANFGTDNDLKISHDNAHARITNSTGSIVVTGIISAINAASIQGIDIKAPSGTTNTIIGNNAGANWSGAQQCVAVGQMAQQANTNSNFNTSVGVSALGALGSNTGSSYSSNTAVGHVAGSQMTTGSTNTLIGANAGSTINSSANTILGKYDGNQGGLDIRSLSGNIVIADGNSNVRFYINPNGNAGIGTTNPDAAVGSGSTAKLSVGIVSAYKFYGDGSNITGVTASGTGIIIKHDGSTVGTAGTINFSTNLDVSGISAGIVTVTASGGSGATDKIEEGDTKVETIDSGDAADAYVTTEVNGTEEIRTIGGQTTIKYLRVGSNWNMANSTGTGIALNYSNTHDLISSSASSGLDIRSNTSIELGQNGSPNYKYAEFRNTQGIFKTNNVERLRYAAGGIDVTGICTATSFSGSGIGLTSLNADNLGSGEIPNGRFPATLPAVSGANLTNLPVPTQITVANEASDQTCNILFTTAATGDLAPKSSSTLTYDANGEVLSATLFSGSGASLTNLNASNIGSGTMSASRLTGALPAISGASLTNLNASNIDSGQMSSSRLTGALPAISGANLTNLPAANLTGTLPAISGANLTGIAVTESPVSSYTISGSSPNYYFSGGGVDESDNNPDLYLIRGQRYRFYNSTGGNHPFRFTSTGNKNDTYSDGVTGSESGTQFFTVPYDAPSRIYYVCTIHSSMVGSIYISGGDAGRRTTAAAATGSIANAAAANISITAAKTYSLLKVQTSAAAWVTLYTDSTSRSNDASRGETTDPTPGSGVIAEVITSGAATQILSPGVIGWNNDSTPSSTVYAKVVNKSGSTQAITVTLHYLQMEI